MTDQSNSNPFVHLLLSLVSLILIVMTAAPVSAQSTAPWWERIDFGGDFRQRFEGFFQDGEETRQRLRFRLRLTVDAEVNDDVAFGLRLGSGDLGDPISTNQSFTNLLTRKPVGLDRVFITYTPSGARALTIGGGKFGIPVARTEMTFDNDLNWEGLWQRVRGVNGPVSYRFVGAQVPLAESRSADDAILYAGFGEVGFAFGGHGLHFSVADYGFQNVDRVAVVLGNAGIGRNSNRYEFDEDGKVIGFVSGFNLVDVIARATLETGRENYPVQLTANFVKNTEAAHDDDSGLWLMASYGQASQPKSYQLGYTYARIEEDAVLSAFTFSDNPGTNMWMHRTTVSYMIARRVHLDFTGIFTKKLNVGPNDPNNLLKRTQLDARISF